MGSYGLDLAQNKYQCRTLVNMIMKFELRNMLGNSRVAEGVTASQDEFSSMELINELFIVHNSCRKIGQFIVIP